VLNPPGEEAGDKADTNAIIDNSSGIPAELLSTNTAGFMCILGIDLDLVCRPNRNHLIVVICNDSTLSLILVWTGHNHVALTLSRDLSLITIAVLSGWHDKMG
jgi:hypothetical protein